MITCEGCGNNEGTEELQPCPYNCDINNDDTPVCNCCADCTQECMNDI